MRILTMDRWQPLQGLGLSGAEPQSQTVCTLAAYKLLS